MAAIPNVLAGAIWTSGSAKGRATAGSIEFYWQLPGKETGDDHQNSRKSGTVETVYKSLS